MLKDNFDYKTQSPDFKYDSKNKTFTTKTYSIKDDSTLIRSIEIYDKTQTTASVRYEVSNVDENFKYNVLIDISNDEYKIIGITKIK